MPTFKTLQEWGDQTNRLLAARPTSTRITTRYRLRPVTAPKSTAASSSNAPAAPTATQPDAKPRGFLEAKTYDPVSGATLKYRTAKAAEVSHLFSLLRGLTRGMAGLPPAPVLAPEADDAKPSEAQGAGEDARKDGPKESGKGGAAAGSSGGPSGGGGGKGKKKKGKR